MIERILIPVDGSEGSMRAVRFAADLVEVNPRAQVFVYTVDRVPLRFLERDLVLLASNIEEGARHIEEVFAEERERYLKEAASVFKKKGIEVRYGYTFGNPAEKIAEYARKNNIDLIIMGTRGLSAVKGLFMGSVSHKVLQLSPCPVTLVK